MEVTEAMQDAATRDQIERANAAVECNLTPDGSPKYESAQGYACALTAIIQCDAMRALEPRASSYSCPNCCCDDCDAGRRIERSALQSQPEARLREALESTADICRTYAEFVRTVPAADLERHPYIPAIEQAVEDADAALSNEGNG